MTDDVQDRVIPRRITPANRRTGFVETINVGGVKAEVAIYFYRNGTPCEVFISGPKPGSPLALVLEDCAVIISIVLQHGIPPRALAKSIARLPIAPNDLDRVGELGLAATVIGAVCDLLVAQCPKPPEDPVLPFPPQGPHAAST